MGHLEISAAFRKRSREPSGREAEPPRPATSADRGWHCRLRAPTALTTPPARDSEWHSRLRTRTAAHAGMPPAPTVTPSTPTSPPSCALPEAGALRLPPREAAPGRCAPIAHLLR